MNREPITMVCYTDIAAQVRGKGFPTRLLKRRLATGIGWTPTNIMITALGPIADTPWGPFGDLILMPDCDTEVRVDFGDGAPGEHFYLSDVLHADGRPWECCPRSFLRRAVAALREEAGVVPHVSFEHEFIYTGANERAGDGYALDAIRRHGEFGEVFMAALTAAGIEADSYLPEYAGGQFEVTYPASDAQSACDRAVVLRELARSAAFRLGHRASFAPRFSPDGLGSGVHLHISLQDELGNPVTHDPNRPYGVSEPAARFVAGIQRHMPALCALTAPTPTSYMRLVPHTWSAAWSNIGWRDREAGIRICPTFETSDRSAAEQYNFEYRAADASANPYIQLGAILHAGLEGLREGLDMPEPTEQDPETLDDETRRLRGIVRLPESLADALAGLDANGTAQGWMTPELLDAYRRYKRSELEITKDWDAAELCRRYAEVY